MKSMIQDGQNQGTRKASLGGRLQAALLAARLLALAGLGVSPARGAVISAPIASDTLWTAAQGPYEVSGTVVVEKGAVLTVEPGAMVVFQSGACLVVRGGLDAVGTDSRPIRFAANVPGGAWNGIYFDHSDAAHSLLEDCVLTSGGIAVEASSPTVLRCSVSGAGTAVRVGGDSDPLIAANTLSGNGCGLSLESATASPVVRRNQVYDNNYGVVLRAFGSPRFSANNILRNRRYNLADMAPKPINMAANDFGPENPRDARRGIYDGSQDPRLGRVILSAEAQDPVASFQPRLVASVNGLFGKGITGGGPVASAMGLGNNLGLEYQFKPFLSMGLAIGYDAFPQNGKVIYASSLDAVGRILPVRMGDLSPYVLGGAGVNLMAVHPAWQGHFHAMAGAGARLNLDSSWGMDLGMVYNFYTPIANPMQALDFHVGVSYGFGM